MAATAAAMVTKKMDRPDSWRKAPPPGPAPRAPDGDRGEHGTQYLAHAPNRQQEDGSYTDDSKGLREDDRGSRDDP